MGCHLFANAKIKLPEDKKTISIRLPSDLIAWYKSQEKGYQTRMETQINEASNPIQKERQQR
jgi:uncharacterized protein (DUF4415 family)